MSTRPITDTLRLLDGGTFIDAASEELANLVKSVDQTGKAGKLSMTLEVKKVSGGAISITPAVKASVPAPKPDSTLLWPTVEGNLSPQNPNQRSLDLRDVTQDRGELKSA